MPDGQTPHTVSLCVYDELVDIAKPGDRIIVTGVFRAVPVRINPRKRAVKSLFKTYLDIVHIHRGDVKRLGFDKSTRNGETKIPGVSSAQGVGIGGDLVEEMEVSTEGQPTEEGQTRSAMLEDTIRQLSQRDDLYDILSRSLAPSIWEMDDVKKGILLQLFGGTNKTVETGGGGGGPRYRGDINVLLVGDPGTSKSQILHVSWPTFGRHSLPNSFLVVCPQDRSQRSIYVWKGLVCCWFDGVRHSRSRYEAIGPRKVRQVLSGMSVFLTGPHSGALVLSDGGVCCIDEFDKMSDATRSVLHEVMVRLSGKVDLDSFVTAMYRNNRLSLSLKLASSRL